MQRKSVSPSKFRPLQISQSPVATSPGKNITGPARVARDITADLFNTIQVWNDHHIKGAQVVKDIALLKGDNLDEYSKGLEDCTNSLYDLVQKLNSCVELFSKYKNQIAALKKVEKKNDPLFISLSISDIEHLIIIIVEGYLEEFKVKQLVLENIAHSSNKDELIFFASSWIHQPHITNQVTLKLETLLIETGHRKIS